MTVPLRLGVFMLGLLAAAGIGAAVGAVVPDQGGASAPDLTSHTSHALATGHTAEEADAANALGLRVAANGYRIDADPVPEMPGEVRFRIVTDDGEPVRSFTEENDALLHLIVVRRDLSGFQHLHPVLDTASGTWSTPARLDRAGTWRLIVDAMANDRDEPTHVVLSSDIEVAGQFSPEPLPSPDDRTEADGYAVTLVRTPTTDPADPVIVTVERDGVPVGDLAPYLGNAGHLVALRAGDLAYTHLHSDAPTGGPELRFAGGLPTAGTYRLFVQFAHGGEVHTAGFSVEVPS